MKVSYFPGCTLRTKAKELDYYARKCAEILGAELCEIENWQCCGGVFVSAKDEIATKLSSVRALVAARDAKQPLVTVCSACHNVIKQTNHAMQSDEDFAVKVNTYLAQDKDFKEPYNGETEVCHYLELLRDKIGFDKIKEAVKNVFDSERAFPDYKNSSATKIKWKTYIPQDIRVYSIDKINEARADRFGKWKKCLENPSANIKNKDLARKLEKLINLIMEEK